MAANTGAAALVHVVGVAPPHCGPAAAAAPNPTGAVAVASCAKPVPVAGVIDLTGSVTAAAGLVTGAAGVVAGVAALLPN